MARPLPEQIEGFKQQISITDAYIDRLKIRLRNLIKRKEDLELKLNPSPIPPVPAEAAPEAPETPEIEKDDFAE